MGNKNTKLTTDQFKQDVLELVGNEYSVLGEYINSKVKITFKHNKCNYVFDMQPSNFKSGQRCPKCRKTERIVNSRKTTEQFKNEVDNLTHGEYEVVGDYKNSSTPINIKHNICNKIFCMSPAHFLNGQRCTNKDCLHERWSDACASKKGNSFEELFEPYKDDYEILVPYKRRNIDMQFRHNKCGCIFTRTPNAFLNDMNSVLHIKCPMCLKNKIREQRAKTQEQFEDEVNKLTDYEYTVVGTYIDTKTKLNLRHNHCGNIWNTTPARFLSGARCPYCSRSKGEEQIAAFLDCNNITYNAQQKFTGLLGIGGRELSYDFYVPDSNLLIEYQGNYHDGTVSIQTEEEFEKQKEHDRLKRQYAKDHSINLLEIWYWDFDNIGKILTQELHIKA